MYDDAAGKEYIDFVSGIAVNVFGHSDPEWAAVVARQSERLSHTSNLYYTEEQVGDCLLASLSFARFC